MPSLAASVGMGKGNKINPVASHARSVLQDFYHTDISPPRAVRRKPADVPRYAYACTSTLYYVYVYAYVCVCVYTVPCMQSSPKGETIIPPWRLPPQPCKYFFFFLFLSFFPCSLFSPSNFFPPFVSVSGPSPDRHKPPR